MKKIKSVAIYKPQEVATFEVGAKLIMGGKETETVVTKISINIFRKVKVEFSDGMVLVFKGFPISYEK